MHVALSRNETHQNFNIWVYGDERLVRGSGLFVGEAGISANHHFLAPRDGSSFRFTEGRYRMEVFAQLLGDRERMMLFSQTLEISREIAAQLAEPDCDLYFDWGPDSSCYLSHIDKRPPLPNEDLLELLNLTGVQSRARVLERSADDAARIFCPINGAGGSPKQRRAHALEAGVPG